MKQSDFSALLSPSDFRPYQERAIDFLLEHPRAGLWQDMGLGKTVATLTALEGMRQRFDVGNVLVIAPLRVARKVWSDEVKRWRHLEHLRVRPIIGTAKQRLQNVNTVADIHTINFENLKWLIDHFKQKGDSRLRQPWPWDAVVLDELYGFRNRNTERWKALYRVVRETEHFFELTGSPAPNGLADVWAPTFFLDFGERLGSSLTAFRDRWFEPPGYGEFKWKPYAHAEKEIHELLGDIVLAMRAEDYLDLPEVVHNTVRIDMPPALWKEYTKLERTYWIELGGHQITAANAGVLFWKLLQLANGAAYVDPNRTWKPFHDLKLQALRELLETSLALGRPVMVMHHFRSDVQRIEELLKKLSVRYRVLKSEQDEDDWNAGKLDVLCLHPGSAGHGLNLQDGGETIVWYGLNPSLELYEQANARLAGGLRRLGKAVRIHQIVVEGTVDEDVIWMLDQKDTTQQRLLQAMRRRFGTPEPPTFEEDEGEDDDEDPLAID